MKKLKVLVAGLFVILFVCSWQLLRYLVIDDTASSTRVMMHEFYNQDNIDILFVGSSFTSYDIDPTVTDELLQANTFNASCAHQTIDTSYALIKEAVKYYDVKQIYLELTDVVARQIDRAERNNLTDIYLISDYMRPSLNKLQFLLEASTMEHYANSFFPARRNWEKLFNPSYLLELAEKKSTDPYKQYGYDYLIAYSTYYAGKGYVICEDVVPEASMYSSWAYEPINYDTISDDWKDTLQDIIEFCEKRDIELVLYYPPFSSFVFAEEDHDAYIQIVEKLLEGTDVRFYDFNLFREEYFPDTTTLFFDAGHLNKDGAALFSRLMSDFITDKISDEDLFYTSYSEKRENLNPMVYGISYREEANEDGTVVNDMKIISNRENIECRVIITPADGEQYMLQDFSKERYFSLPLEERGICTIVWRTEENPEKVQTIEISF